MASLRDAEEARKRQSHRFTEAVHAIGVESDDGSGSQDSWVVVAYVDPGGDADVPEFLTFKRGGRRVRVPVRIAETNRYQLE